MAVRSTALRRSLALDSCYFADVIGTAMIVASMVATTFLCRR